MTDHGVQLLQHCLVMKINGAWRGTESESLHIQYWKEINMKIEKQRNSDMDKIAKFIDAAAVGMLTTIGDDGTLSSRPMMPLAMDNEGSLWFFTKRSATDKEAPVNALNLTFTNQSDGKFVALSGESTLLHDQSKIDELWSPMAKPWFPQGPKDPSLALLRVDVLGGEYWSSSSSAVVRFTTHLVSALAGKEIGLGENKTVQNR
jgi:general stress protein 26